MSMDFWAGLGFGLSIGLGIALAVALFAQPLRNMRDSFRPSPPTEPKRNVSRSPVSMWGEKEEAA